MTIQIEQERAKAVADLLYTSFKTTGIHGQKDMPGEILPDGIQKGSLEHILFITLTVSINYQRNADQLWESARRTYADPETRYLFNPEQLHKTPLSMIIRDMQKYRLSRKPQQDANTWCTIGISFYKKWQGDPRKFLASCDWSAPSILDRLKNDTSVDINDGKGDFISLRGDKIGPLWLRMLWDNVGMLEIKNLYQVPIPVDIHVARATLALGIVRGQYNGGLTNLFENIREAWFQGVKGLSAENRPMIALDVDEPLWHLSKNGCTDRDKQSGECPKKGSCELHDHCIPGIININNGTVELDT